MTHQYNEEQVRELLASGELPDIVSAFEVLWAAREAGNVQLGERIGQSLLNECNSFMDSMDDAESKELRQLLNDPHIKAIVESYDGVVLEREEAKRSATEISAPSGGFAQETQQHAGSVNGDAALGDVGPLKLIGLNRVGNESLGLVLKAVDDKVRISRIVVNMAADRQGLLKVGDVIRSINGKDVNSDVDMVKREISSTSGTISMKVEASFTDPLPSSQVYMRALFNYDPETDQDHPFRKGGLAFQRGDIVQIVNQEDPLWWQARVEGGERADKGGIIPGLLLEERRQALARDPGPPERTTGCIGIRRRSKPPPIMYTSTRNCEFDRHELNIYEEVARISPGQRKTVVLIGAQGVGRRGLKHRIIGGNMDMYATTLPHTTRFPKPEEENGKQYWFVTEHVMREDIAAHKYIEHGVFNDHLYGTKIDSIRAVIRSGKICLLDVNPQSLKRLKTAEFKPYVIFIRAPTFETLKRMHHDATRNARGGDSLMPYSDDDIRRTIAESENIEKAYCHYFDMTVTNTGIDQTYAKLDAVLKDLQSTTQWVPINWVF